MFQRLLKRVGSYINGSLRSLIETGKGRPTGEKKKNRKDFSMMMDSDQFVAASGPVDARYLAFLETVSTLRPSLHRYCARMTGSVMDGEDVVQEALIEAYRKLDQFDESRPLKPWLFRIAHNRSIDFLRRKGVRDEAEAAAAVPEAVSPAEPASLALALQLNVW